MPSHPILHRRVEPLRWHARPRGPLWRRECVLAALGLMLLAAALLVPPVVQPSHYHDFADQRRWGALPHAMDVLSNLPFLLWGLAGLAVLRGAVRDKVVQGAAAATAGLFLGGLCVTAAVSAVYHLQPGDASLAWDRAGMVLAFAGLLGLAAVQAVSTRAGLVLAALVVLLGLASVQLGAMTGNVLPWAALQLGGVALVLAAAFLRPVEAGALPLRWGWVAGIYAVAKLLELGDLAVYDLTGQSVSGHTLKHVVASFAAWPVVSALLSARKIRAESVAALSTSRACASAVARATTTETRSPA